MIFKNKHIKYYKNIYSKIKIYEENVNNRNTDANDKSSENLGKYLDSKNCSSILINVSNNFKYIFIDILLDFIYIFININISS